MKHYRILILLFICVLYLPSGFAQDITQWRVLEGDETPPGPTAVNAITFSPDGTQLAVASVDGIIVYDTYTGKVLALLPSLAGHVTALAFSSDNRIVASANEDATVQLWNARTGEDIIGFTSHTDPVVTLAFSPDGNTLAGGGFKEIRLWDLTLGQMTRAAVLRGHQDMVTTLAFSPDGKVLASASFYGTILLWDVETTQRRHSLSAHTGSILALAFSADSQTLASGGYWNAEAESTIRVWHIHTGQLLATFENHTTPVFALTFMPDAHGVNSGTLASAGWDDTIRMWDPRAGQLQAIFHENTAPIIALAFLPTAHDGSKMLASASLDGTIQLKSLPAVLSQVPWDVNNDGIVNILDLTFIVSRFGQSSPDLNGDGIVNILDLMLVANRIGL